MDSILKKLAKSRQRSKSRSKSKSPVKYANIDEDFEHWNNQPDPDDFSEHISRRSEETQTSHHLSSDHEQHHHHHINNHQQQEQPRRLRHQNHPEHNFQKQEARKSVVCSMTLLFGTLRRAAVNLLKLDVRHRICLTLKYTCLFI